MWLFLLACAPKAPPPLVPSPMAEVPPVVLPPPVVVEPAPWEKVHPPALEGGTEIAGSRVTFVGGRLWLERQEVLDGSMLKPGSEATLWMDATETAGNLRRVVEALRGAGLQYLRLALADQKALPLPLKLADSGLILQKMEGGFGVGRGTPLIPVADLPSALRLLPPPQGTLSLRVEETTPLSVLLPLFQEVQRSGWAFSLEAPGTLSSSLLPSPPYSLQSPRSVSISEEGTFQLDQARITVDHISGFYQQCNAGSCGVIALLENGEGWYLGHFPERTDPWIFQRPVGIWEGKLPKKEPKITGSLSTLVGVPHPSTSTSTVENGASTGNSMTDAVVACYTAALQRNPACRGTVVVTGTFASDGRMMGARLSSSALQDSTADACIVAAVQSFAKGSRSNGITVIQFPFTLSPG